MKRSAGSTRARAPRAAPAATRRPGTPARAAVPPLAPTHPAALATAVVAALSIAVSVTFLIYETDFWQHLLVGRVIWDTRSIPAQELWSWPTYGAPDANSSWGFRALVYPFWALGGVWGLFVWRWVTTLTAFALLWRAARRLGAHGLTPLVALVVAALAYAGRSQIRPETWVAVLIALEIWILETRRSGGPDRTPWLVAIAWVWINSHISYHVGFAVLGAYFVDALIARGRARAVDRARARAPRGEGAPLTAESPAPPEAAPAARGPLRLALVAIAALAVSFVNPFGWHALWQPFDYLLHQSREPIYVTIGELERLRWSENIVNGVPILVFGWPVLLIARARRHGIDWAEALLAALFIPLALVSVRFVGFLALVASPFLARDLDALFRAWRRPGWAADPRLRGAAAAVACVLVALPAWARAHLGVGFEWRYFPVRSCDFIERHDVRGRGYNTFSYGGYLLYRFWPDRGRLPFMDIHQAGTPELRRLYTFSLERPEYWRELDGQMHFDWALLARLTFAADHLRDFLDADTSWALVFQDDAALLYVRRDGTAGGLAHSFGYRVVPGGNARLSAVAAELPRDASLRAEFRAELERQARESPHNSQAHQLLANLALLEGRLSDARNEMALALAADRYNGELERQLAALDRQLNRTPPRRR